MPPAVRAIAGFFFISNLQERYFSFVRYTHFYRRIALWRLFQQLNVFMKKGFDMAGAGR